ncbi:TIGR03936 family radical SAM-associated protein [Desulfofalx alkaliphila]|uniref:TIGR03936 family radical SAM-associated protein n=1 Tax=Desulfofalx alkaliphila TaxID=105483 RepID=UPI00146FC7C9|nr:TIGR03936 family radical SAM-associated protein [Desulfofalx alkaliphila]
MFAKAGISRYISHLDLTRVFERAARRAEMPMAYSQGFNPHPKISFAVPLALGVIGEKEFVDMELTVELPPEHIAEQLNKNLPMGIKVVEVRQVGEKEKPLMARVKQASYRMECPLAEEIDTPGVERVVDEILGQRALKVERKVKGKLKTADIRPGIINLKGYVQKGEIVIETELATGSGGNVRPEELLKELKKAGLPIEYALCRIYRTGLHGSSGDAREELW